MIYLAEKIPWFGAHTGYEQLPQFLTPAGNGVRIVSPRSGIVPRLVGKGFSYLKRWPARNQTATAAELEFAWQWKRRRARVAHIIYLERHLLFLTQWNRAPKHLVGTIHLPISEWKKDQLSQLSHLQSAIILYRRDREAFEKHVGSGRTMFIHHGVDVDFFSPDRSVTHQRPRLLFGGVYLRNTSMLLRVIRRLLAKNTDLIFDLLVPVHGRANPDFVELQKFPQVVWHAGLDDEQLRALYQQSYLALLPMNNSGANTAVVEALACGLPLITTNVGGIRDYGGDDVFPIVENDDDDAMVDLVERYLANTTWRDQVSNSCRHFAEKTLAWPSVARQHLDAYAVLSA